jgi:hypothetical protein
MILEHLSSSCPHPVNGLTFCVDCHFNVIHMPPSKLEPDHCSDRQQDFDGPPGATLLAGQVSRAAGSKAIYDFLLEHQSALSLYGHIHESPKVSGRWHARIGDTLCIQPGQPAPSPTSPLTCPRPRLTATRNPTRHSLHSPFFDPTIDPTERGFLCSGLPLLGHFDVTSPLS